MSFGTTLALFIVSFFGIIFWSMVSAASTNVAKVKDSLEMERTWASKIAGRLTVLSAVAITVAPLAVIVWKAAVA